MRILVTYDVETISPSGAKRLRHVAKACMDYGQRVQNSVFECLVTEVQYLELKNRLEHIIDIEADSIRFYHLSPKLNKAVETIGKLTSYDPEATLLI